MSYMASYRRVVDPAVALVPFNSTSFSVSGLMYGTRYYVSTRAIASSVYANSFTVSSEVLMCTAPFPNTQVSFVVLSPTSTQVSWSAASV
jgi:hypothetical protein